MNQSSQQKFQIRLTFHGRLAHGGSVYMYQLVGFPGIHVKRVKQNRKASVEETIEFDGKVFEHPGEAVEAWKKKQNENLIDSWVAEGGPKEEPV